MYTSVEGWGEGADAGSGPELIKVDELWDLDHGDWGIHLDGNVYRVTVLRLDTACPGAPRSS